jgi:hypothetical protein
MNCGSALMVAFWIKIHTQQPLHANQRRYENGLRSLAFGKYDSVRFERRSPCGVLFLGNLTTGLFNSASDDISWKVERGWQALNKVLVGLQLAQK